MNKLLESIGQAWNEELMPASERVALCALMFVEPDVASQRWESIPAPTREKLVLAFRRAIDLGAVCSKAMLRAQSR